MPIKVTILDDLTVRIPVGDSDKKQSLAVRYLPSDAIRELRTKTMHRQLNRKTHQFEEKIDEEKFAAGFLDRALASFDNISWATFADEMLEKNIRIEVEGDRGSLIPSSGPEWEQARQLFIEHGEASLHLRIVRSARDEFDEAIQAQQEAERGNS